MNESAIRVLRETKAELEQQLAGIDLALEALGARAENQKKKSQQPEPSKKNVGRNLRHQELAASLLQLLPEGEFTTSAAVKVAGADGVFWAALQHEAERAYRARASGSRERHKVASLLRSLHRANRVEIVKQGGKREFDGTLWKVSS